MVEGLNTQDTAKLKMFAWDNKDVCHLTAYLQQLMSEKEQTQELIVKAIQECMGSRSGPAQAAWGWAGLQGLP